MKKILYFLLVGSMVVSNVISVYANEDMVIQDELVDIQDELVDIQDELVDKQDESIIEEKSIQREFDDNLKIEKKIENDIILELNKLNFLNPIEFNKSSKNIYNIDIFDKLFEYGDLNLTIESNDGEIVINEIVSKNKDIEVNLKDKDYMCEMHIIKKDGSTLTFLGEIIFENGNINYNNLLVDEADHSAVPVVSDQESLSKLIQPFAVTYEKEPNNTMAQANIIKDDDYMYGTMTADREDYYKITFSKSGVANFWLGDIPAGKNHNLYVYEGSTLKWQSSSTTAMTQRLINQVPVKANTTYYIRVSYPSGTIPTYANYVIRVKLYEISYVTDSKRITAPFGYSSYYGEVFHRGIDIGALKQGVAGDNIYSMLDGSVISSFWDDRNGNVVSLRHLLNPALKNNSDKYLNSRYLHLSNRFVNNKQSVKSGQIIGEMGNTGLDSYGVHLHFEVGSHNDENSNRWDGALIDPIINFFPTISKMAMSREAYTGNEVDISNNSGILINSSVYLDLEYLKNITIDEIVKLGINANDLIEFKTLMNNKSIVSFSSDENDMDNINYLIKQLSNSK